jgi:2-polyprenyl-3-methyl-5-hydroxy-6-metoxy-1,4-benzoquinol methylase
MNKDQKVIEDFGDEWADFTYESKTIHQAELEKNFLQYFSIFPWKNIPNNAEGFDMGCGSGRWAQFVAPKVHALNCIEPSKAIDVAKVNLQKLDNVSFFHETTDSCSLNDQSQDFGYCLGVLHHIPDTKQALSDCARLLKKGAPFLLYLYYNLDNRPIWYRYTWKLSDFARNIISILPRTMKKAFCFLIAALIYLPLSRFALFVELLGLNVSNFLLSDYRNKPFYQMRNDALDRFGTRLEQRFSRQQIEDMLLESGFEDISFSEEMPFWTSISYKS